MILYSPERGEFGMKNLNRIEIEEFTDKYFPNYKGDIRKVSYVIYEDREEYLINNYYIFVKF